MVDSSCGTEPHLDKSEEHQPHCETVQCTESDKVVSIKENGQEGASGHVVIQDDACGGLESANVQGIDTNLIVVIPEVNQTNVATTETEEQSTDITNEPQDQKDWEGPIIKLIDDLDKVENETETTFSPEPQTFQEDQSSPNSSHELSLHVNGDDMLFQEIEETSMDPKARDDHSERLSDTILEHIEEMCFSSEIQLEATEETESLMPPAKKRLRRRMGMCGLGDRKRKFLFDVQHCMQGPTGRPMEKGAFKGNKGVQHLFNTVLENDGTMPMDHEGTTGPACKENDEKLLEAKENNGAAVMDNNRTGEAEKENTYALRHDMSKCTAFMNDEEITDESPKENGDVLKKGISEENYGTIFMDDKGTAEQVVLEHQLNLLEEITGLGETLPSPTAGKNLNMIRDEQSAAALNEHEMETATCGAEPNFFPGTEITNNEQDIEFNMKHEVLSEKQNDPADNKLDMDPDQIAAEVEVAQEVSCGLICAKVERSEGSVTKEVQAAPTGLEDCEIEIEEQVPSLAATEKHDQDGPEQTKVTEKGLTPLFDNMGILAVASTYDAHNAKGHGENDESITAVLGSTEPSGGDAEDAKEANEPQAPPTGQENHMHCFLDQNACDTFVSPTVAEQLVCNPTLIPAANKLPQETDLSVSPLLYSMTDSQIHKIALSMELEDQPEPKDCDQLEDSTELVRGLIRELSSLNRTVMAAHREMELLRRGKLSKAPNRRLCGPRHAEK